MHKIEKAVWKQLLRLGRQALTQVFALLGNGDLGESVFALLGNGDLGESNGQRFYGKLLYTGHRRRGFPGRYTGAKRVFPSKTAGTVIAPARAA
jgi:hypothetical protein